MHATRFALISLALVLFGFLAHSNAEDWYRWRGPRLDGISAETCQWAWPEGGPTIAWKQSVGIGFSSIVVKDGRAFTIGHADQQDVISCLDAATGKVIWTVSYPANLDDRDFEGGPTSTPTVDGDRVYVVARAGDLFCLKASDGTQLWKTNLAAETEIRLPGWGLSGAPLVVDEILLINMGEAGAAIDKSSGKVLWSSADRECGYATPVIIPNSEPAKAIFASGRAYVGVDLQSGNQLWSERWLTSFNCNSADPIFHDGKMFLSSGYNRGAALFDITSEAPQLLWKSKEMKNQIHTSLLHAGYLYGIDGDMEAGARLVCMEWSTGNVAWAVDDLNPGGLTLADGKLILLTQSGTLIVAPASPERWAPQSTANIIDGKCWTTPVLSNGRLFCRSIQGQVVCVDCRN